MDGTRIDLDRITTTGIETRACPRRADKARDVKRVLRAKPVLSNSAIGAFCGVDHKTVARYRAELEASGEIPKSESRVGLDGRTIDVSNVGRKSSPAPREPPERAREQQPPVARAEEAVETGAVQDGDLGDSPSETTERSQTQEPRAATQASPSQLYQRAQQSIGDVKWRVSNDLGPQWVGDQPRKILILLNKAAELLEGWRVESGITQE